MLSKKLLSLPLFLFLAVGLYASAAFAIDPPRELRGTEIRQEVIKWEWEPPQGAVKYKVTVDGIDMGTTEGTKFFSYDMWPGDHSMHLVAVAADGTESPRTQTAKIVTSKVFSYGTHGRSYLVGDAPVSGSSASSAPQSQSSQGSSNDTSRAMVQNLSHQVRGGGNIRWSWSSFPGAVSYELTIDGVDIKTTQETMYDSTGLWNGEHSLTVKAVDNSGRKTVQSDTLKIVVSGSESANSREASSPPPPPPVLITAEDASAAPAPPPSAPVPSNDGVNNSVKRVSSVLVDPQSYNYSEVNNMSGFELVFSDEFNGSALNEDRWHSQLRWDGEWNGERFEYRRINNEDQFYVNTLSPDPEHRKNIIPVYNPFKFNGSALAIQAVRNPLRDREKTKSHGKLSEMVRQQPFLSGAISTHEKFAQKYGRFEARIKIPSHVGTFPAFWLFHAKRAWEGTQRTEIDVMENLGHAPEYVYNSFHYFTNVSRTYGGDANFIKPKPNGQIFTGVDFSKNFHTYAVDWEPGKVTWYIDGVQTSELNNGMVDFEELYLMLNLAVGGNWTNFPTTAGGLGRSGNERYPTQRDIDEFSNPQLEIDFVRVYRRN